MFGYVRGGYRTIIARLAERLEQQNATVLTDHVTKAVRKQDDGTFEISFRNQASQQFDRVIMTTPSNVVGNTCGDLDSDELSKLNNTSYLGIVNASMLLKKKLSPYYVTNITDSWVPMTAVIEMSNIVDMEETDGKSLVYLPKYVPAGHPLFEKSNEEIEDEFLTAVERMHPDFSRDDVDAFRISRVKHVMAIPTLGYSETLPDQKTSVPGLYIVNSAYITKGNLNVNETITIAEDALEGCLKNELASDVARRSTPRVRRLATATV